MFRLSSGANWGGWGPSPPKISKMIYIFFIGFIDSSSICTRISSISIYRVMIQGFWHDGAKKFFLRHEKFCPPQEICELALLRLRYRLIRFLPTYWEQTLFGQRTCGTRNSMQYESSCGGGGKILTKDTENQDKQLNG